MTSMTKDLKPREKSSPNANPGPMRSEPQFFYEDEVYRVNRGGRLQFGMVVENAEFVSSDESDDDDLLGKKLKQGFARVAWHPKGREEIVRESKIKLADRSLLPGDVVRRLIPGRDTQRGYCQEVSVKASVGIVGTKQVVFSVDSIDLIPLEDFTQDVAVSLDSWIGMIRHVKSKIKVRFPDGSICSLDDHVAEELEDLLDKRDDECEFKRYDFYPGQILRGPLKAFEDGEFEFCTDQLKNIRNSGKGNQLFRVFVENVEVVSLHVHWQCRAYSAADAKESVIVHSDQPAYLVTGDALKRVRMLNVFEPCTLQIGDRNFYTLKPEDLILLQDEWQQLEKESFLRIGPEDQASNEVRGGTDVKKRRRRFDKKAAEKKDNDSDSDYEDEAKDLDTVGCTASSTCSDNSTPQQLPGSSSSTGAILKKRIRTSTRGESESSTTGRMPTVPASTLRPPVAAVLGLGAGKKKRKFRRFAKSNGDRLATSQDISDLSSLKFRHVKPGDRVVVETFCTKTTATVVWQDGSVETNIPSTELFPIHALDEQEFFPGDCVVRCPETSTGTFDPHLYGVVQSVDHSGRTCLVQWFRTYTTGSDPRPAKLDITEEPVYDLRDHPDFKYRPGSVVIRVANFPELPTGVNESDAVVRQHCFGGQVLDNCTDGQTKVWWVDGSVSNTWPQDLYKIGEYDSDDGELWDEDDEEEEDDFGSEDSYTSEGSWETESEKSLTGEASSSVKTDEATLRSKLSANVDRARVALKRVDELCNDNMSLPSAVVMKHLLDLYKDGKELDRLMGAEFFDETLFGGLIEKVRERTRAASAHQEAVHEQVTRLFSVSDPNKSAVESAADVSTSSDVFQDTTGELSLKDDLAQELPTKQIISRLCLLLQNQLNKLHEELMRRFGGQAGAFTPEDLALSPGEEQLKDLESIMNQVFKISMENLYKHAAAIFPGILIGVDPTEKEQNPLPSTEASADSLTSTKAATEPTAMETSLETPTKARGSVSAHDISMTLYGTPDELKSKQTPTPTTPSTSSCESGEFTILDSSKDWEHKFKLSMFQPSDPKNFIKFLRIEIQLLRSSLPHGIVVKGFEDRMDLFSVMIKGPERTPYEDGLFFFDLQLPQDYPKAPPIVHYHSFCSDRLNPNLYEDGKVCVSLLGTWSGKGTETWTPNSNLLQLLVSIQGLILVREPYFNEAGYDRQRGTQQGTENSRMYNEMVLLKLVQSLTRMVNRPPEMFASEVRQHFTLHSEKLINRLERWRRLSVGEADNTNPSEGQDEPEFPLLPTSKGFCIALQKALNVFRETLKTASVWNSEN